MTTHIFNGRTLSMIANEHGIPYRKLYFLVVTRGAPIKEALRYLTAKMDLEDALSATRKGTKRCA